MSVDPPRDERLEGLLREIGRTLEGNRVFLDGLQHDNGTDDEVAVSSDDMLPADEEFEEL